MLDLLRTHGKKILTGLLCVTALGSVGMTAYQRTTSSCCSAGSSCCYPGSPCCHGHDHALAAR